MHESLRPWPKRPHRPRKRPDTDRRDGAGRRCRPSTCAASARPRSRSCCAWRRCARRCACSSLLVLDLVGVFAAIYVALMVKAVLRYGDWAWHASYDEARETVAFAVAGHGAAVRALGPVRVARRAPRPVADRLVAVPGDGRRADLRARQRRDVLELLHLLRHARVRDRASSARCGGCTRASPALLLRAAGYRRRAVLVGSGKHIEDVAHALIDEVHAPVEMVGFISLTPRPDNGLRSLGRIRGPAGGARRATASRR